MMKLTYAFACDLVNGKVAIDYIPEQFDDCGACVEYRGSGTVHVDRLGNIEFVATYNSEALTNQELADIRELAIEGFNQIDHQ